MLAGERNMMRSQDQQRGRGLSSRPSGDRRNLLLAGGNRWTVEDMAIHSQS